MEIQFTKQGKKITHETGVIQIILLEQLENQKLELQTEKEQIDEQIASLDNSINSVRLAVS